MAESFPTIGRRYRFTFIHGSTVTGTYQGRFHMGNRDTQAYYFSVKTANSRGKGFTASYNEASLVSFRRV